MKSGVHGGWRVEHFRTIIFRPCLPSERHPSVKRVTNPWWLDYMAARLCWMHIIYRSITAPPCIRLCAVVPSGEASCVLLDYHETRARPQEKKRKKTSRKSGRREFPFQKASTLQKHKHEGLLPAVGASQRCGRALGGTPQLVYPSRFSSYRF